MIISRYSFVSSLSFVTVMTLIFGGPLLLGQMHEILGTPQVDGSLLTLASFFLFFLYNPITPFFLLIVLLCNIDYCKNVLKELESSDAFNTIVKPPFSLMRVICLLAGAIFLILTAFFIIKLSLFYTSSDSLGFEALFITTYWLLTTIAVIPAFVFSMAYMRKLGKSKKKALLAQSRKQLRLLYVALVAYSIPGIYFIVSNVSSMAQSINLPL